MEQEIQTCRFNSAGKGREAPSPSIHSLRRDSSLFFLFFHPLFPPCVFHAFSFFFAFGDPLRSRSKVKPDSAVPVHLRVLSSDVQARSREWKNVRLRRRDVSAAVSKELLLLLESHLKLWLSHQVHTRHLVGLFFFFFFCFSFPPQLALPTHKAALILMY